ncbi:MAG: hypothetical protein HC924_15985 [Synechococcaceae cyanobacterium SM2_3_2]|nr:hypothetical protein [Synechococcaceae cyanobacterium SM2_3_2]
MTVRNPIITLGLTFQLDPATVFDAMACNQPIHPSVLPFVASAAPSCIPALAGGIPVDPVFDMRALTDSNDKIPVDDNDLYPIEG